MFKKLKSTFKKLVDNEPATSGGGSTKPTAPSEPDDGLDAEQRAYV